MRAPGPFPHAVPGTFETLANLNSAADGIRRSCAGRQTFGHPPLPAPSPAACAARGAPGQAHARVDSVSMFAAIEAAFGRTFLSLCRSASVSDCFRSMRCCHLRFSWLSSRCLPIATQYYWKGLPPLPGGTHCAAEAGAASRRRALRGKSGQRAGKTLQTEAEKIGRFDVYYRLKWPRARHEIAILHAHPWP